MPVPTSRMRSCSGAPGWQARLGLRCRWRPAQAAARREPAAAAGAARLTRRRPRRASAAARRSSRPSWRARPPRTWARKGALDRSALAARSAARPAVRRLEGRPAHQFSPSSPCCSRLRSSSSYTLSQCACVPSFDPASSSSSPELLSSIAPEPREPARAATARRRAAAACYVSPQLCAARPPVAQAYARAVRCAAKPASARDAQHLHAAQLSAAQLALHAPRWTRRGGCRSSYRRLRVVALPLLVLGRRQPAARQDTGSLHESSACSVQACRAPTFGLALHTMKTRLRRMTTRQASHRRRTAALTFIVTCTSTAGRIQALFQDSVCVLLGGARALIGSVARLALHLRGALPKLKSLRALSHLQAPLAVLPHELHQEGTHGHVRPHAAHS